MAVAVLDCTFENIARYCFARYCFWAAVGEVFAALYKVWPNYVTVTKRRANSLLAIYRRCGR